MVTFCQKKTLVKAKTGNFDKLQKFGSKFSLLGYQERPLLQGLLRGRVRHTTIEYNTIMMVEEEVYHHTSITMTAVTKNYSLVTQ